MNEMSNIQENNMNKFLLKVRTLSGYKLINENIELEYTIDIFNRINYILHTNIHNLECLDKVFKNIQSLNYELYMSSDIEKTRITPFDIIKDKIFNNQIEITIIFLYINEIQNKYFMTNFINSYLVAVNSYIHPKSLCENYDFTILNNYNKNNQMNMLFESRNDINTQLLYKIISKIKNPLEILEIICYNNNIFILKKNGNIEYFYLIKKNKYKWNIIANNIKKIFVPLRYNFKPNDYINNSGFVAITNDNSVIEIIYNPSIDNNLIPCIKFIIDSDVVDIFFNDYAYVAIKTNKTIFAWGNTKYGGILPNNIQNTKFKKIIPSEKSFCAITDDDCLINWGKIYKVPEIKIKIETIVVSGRAYAALCCGNVYTWGDSFYGGNSNELKNELLSGNIIKLLSISERFAVLDNKGDVYIWGAEENIIKHRKKRVVDIVSNYCQIVGINYDGTIELWHEYGKPSYSCPDINNVQNIIGNNNGFAAICSNNEIIIWHDIENTIAFNNVKYINLYSHFFLLIIDDEVYIYNPTKSYEALYINDYDNIIKFFEITVQLPPERPLWMN